MIKNRSTQLVKERNKLRRRVQELEQQLTETKNKKNEFELGFYVERRRAIAAETSLRAVRSLYVYQEER